MAPLTAGDRYHVLPSSSGGVEQRWVMIASEPRQAHAKRTVDKQLRKQSAQAVHALKNLCRNTFACETEARQALAAFAHGLQATYLHDSTVCPTPLHGKRGRPRPGTPPDHVVYHIQGTLASCLAVRQGLMEQHSCFILATNERDETTLSPQDVLNGYTGQAQAERGFRFLKDPSFLASSLYLKTPERIIALFRVMTVCLLVYAALEYRMRKALKDHDATFPNQKGAPVQNPTARWIFQYFVGIPVLLIPRQ